MEVIDMNGLTDIQKTQAAQILTDSLPLGWATLEDAEQEIAECLIPKNTMLAAVENGEVLGWGGILPMYGGNVYELHPLAVKQSKRGMGIGKALVTALEYKARERGGLTMWIGADDELPGGETSFANTDLYENFHEKLRDFIPGTHQAAFYMKMGYIIIGAVPDANGTGKPDIYLAKKL